MVVGFLNLRRFELAGVLTGVALLSEDSQMKLSNYVSGQWQDGAGPGEPLVDPVTGEELARISSQGDRRKRRS